MLKGTLDDFTLSDVLRLVAAARRTGCLDVTRDGGGGRLWFRDGAVAAVVPGYDRRREAETHEARIEDLAFDLMRWDLGEFTWAAGADGAPAGTAVAVDGLLATVARRLEELAEVRTLVPSEETVLSWAPQPPEGAVQINIAPSEWRVLVLVDGRRSVAEIATAAGLDDVEAMKVLFGLATAGLVGPAAAPAAPPLPPEPASDTTDTTVVSAASDPSDDDLPTAGEAPEPVPDPEPEPPSVDRSTAARELAGLFDFSDAGALTLAGAMVPSPPRTPRRVEDDDQVTRGLITRLIDGVKGL